MIRVTPMLSTCLFLVLVASACSKRVQDPGASPSPEVPKISSESVVKAAVESVEIPVGGSNEAVVRVIVQPGYHINANPPTYPYLKATELDLTDTERVSVDYTYYPNPLVKKFAFAEEPLRVYEGETQLKVLLNAAKTAQKGNQSISGKLRIQACDDKVCYPPGLLEVVIPVVIK
jgi:thiol:disulfide interchange protein DsbD